MKLGAKLQINITLITTADKFITEIYNTMFLKPRDMFFLYNYAYSMIITYIINAQTYATHKE